MPKKPKKKKQYDKLPKDVKKGDVFKLKMGKAYVTVTVQDVKQKSAKHAKVVSYQYKTPS